MAAIVDPIEAYTDARRAADDARRAADRAVRNHLSTDNILRLFDRLHPTLSARDVCRLLAVPLSRRTYAASQLDRMVHSQQLVRSTHQGRDTYAKRPPPPRPVIIQAPPQLVVADAEPAETVEQARKRQCVICVDRDRVMLLLPCRHFALCEECAAEVQVDGSCPTCRTHVDEAIKVIFS